MRNKGTSAPTPYSSHFPFSLFLIFVQPPFLIYLFYLISLNCITLLFLFSLLFFSFYSLSPVYFSFQLDLFCKFIFLFPFLCIRLFSLFCFSYAYLCFFCFHRIQFLVLLSVIKWITFEFMFSPFFLPLRVFISPSSEFLSLFSCFHLSLSPYAHLSVQQSNIYSSPPPNETQFSVNFAACQSLSVEVRRNSDLRKINWEKGRKRNRREWKERKGIEGKEKG